MRFSEVHHLISWLAQYGKQKQTYKNLSRLELSIIGYRKKSKWETVTTMNLNANVGSLMN